MDIAKIFKNEEFGEIRTFVIGEDPYFAWEDIARILGYPRNMIRRISEHDRIMVYEKAQRRFGIELGPRGGWVISEIGFHNLVSSSKMPNARKFEKWVESKVIPEIQKEIKHAMEEPLKNPELAVEALKREYNLVKYLKRIIIILKQQMLEKTGKINYYDIILNCKDTVSITRIAKDYGWSVKRLHNYLHEKGVLTKRGKIWLLEHEYVNKGYTKTKVRTDNEGKLLEVNTRWTPAGRLFIYELLDSDGILPLIERKRG